MRTLLIVTALSILTAPTTAFYKGLNFGAALPNGACRSQADWARAFRAMRNSAAHFEVVRVFASSDCNTLANAVPAALSVGVKLLAGVWTQNDAHYAAEKQALLNALQAWPKWQDWLIAVSVGSEDLYRKEVNGSQITPKVYDVRGMLRAKGVTVPIGHVDTWTAWYE
jgi:exo-beta-1,3-glucanase (GH17 family)